MITLLAALVTLETATTRIGFDPAQNGGITSLVEKASGRDFVASKPAGARLYELLFKNSSAPDSPVTTLTDADAVDAVVKHEGDSILISIPRHAKAAVSVECRFRTEPGSILIHGRIAVRNDTEMVLSQVRFPTVTWTSQPGAAADREFLVLPACDGCLIQAPGTLDYLPTQQYPGVGSMQFVAVYDDQAGFYAAAYDNSCQTKNLGMIKQKTGLRLLMMHLPPQQPHGRWQTDYDVVLGTFHGDWQTAADLYKQWAVKQPWCQRTLAQRVAAGDVPRWLTEPSLFYTCTLLPGNGSSELPYGKTALPTAESWRQLLGAPVTFMMMNWEKHGAWVTPDYFPPIGGDQQFKSTTQALHEKGHHTLLFLSGLNWTLLKKRHPQDPLFDDTAGFERRGTASAITGPDLKPAHRGKSESDVGEHVQICPTTPLAREILLGSAMRCQQLGLDCVQADQLVGGGMPACYDTRHGHPAGNGNWSGAALYKLFEATRKEARKQSKDFAFSMEEPGEYFIPVLDTYHARDYAQGRWPRSGRNVIGVPLFTHVYHEYMHGYGGDSCPVSAKPDPTALYGQGMNLVCGKAAGVADWSGRYDPKTTDPVQLKLLRGHCDLWAGPAREYLVFGSRITSPPLKVSTVHTKFWVGQNQPPRELEFPAVLHNVWRLPDGRFGTVLACIAAEPVSFDLNGQAVTLQPGEVKFLETKAGR